MRLYYIVVTLYQYRLLIWLLILRFRESVPYTSPTLKHRKAIVAYESSGYFLM
ncbi:hypothetical protein JCM19297_2135 [Nonlabens ulvanivorans]|nr:hypothetical protein [Nonlabens ulvanivorans]GAK90123.1 hypothetical protein JCM19297_2135 [Nonlabens ulvanivorans]